MTSALFAPITLAGLTLPNRLVVAPMCQYSADDGSATDWHLAHLGTLANSGAGLVMIEATAVERRGRITHGCLGLYSDANEAALARVLAHCRRWGAARIGIQLGHAGRKASAQLPWAGGNALRPEEDPWPTIAPSALPFADDWPAPQAMTEADMARLRAAFVAAAGRALRLGIDLIELHAAHGYLLHEFLSPVANRRGDAYGGSLSNRMRLPLEIVAAVRAAWPEGRPLGLRITGSDWIEGGITPDEAVAFARAVKEAGCDYVCVSSGGISPAAKIALGPGYQVPFAAKVRREAGIATRAVGLIATPRAAERIVAQGEADMVAMARAFLDQPHWGWMAARALGAEEAVRRPPQYLRAAPKLWPGAAYADAPAAAAE
jgi:NADPH2 dehydrogenase